MVLQQRSFHLINLFYNKIKTNLLLRKTCRQIIAASLTININLNFSSGSVS
jgi:hypothetical protein